MASIKSTTRNKSRLFPSPFLISTSRFCILDETFHNDHVAACSTALRSSTEKIEKGGYVTVPCSSKMTQRIITADWTEFQWRDQIGCDGPHTEQAITSKVTLQVTVLIDKANLLTLSIAV